MKKYKVKLKQEACTGLIAIIEKIIQEEVIADTCTKVMLAGLEEVLRLVKKKTLDFSTVYKFTFSSTQALALQCLYEYYVEPHGRLTGYLENHLRRIANEVHQQYQ